MRSGLAAVLQGWGESLRESWTNAMSAQMRRSAFPMLCWVRRLDGQAPQQASATQGAWQMGMGVEGRGSDARTML